VFVCIGVRCTVFVFERDRERETERERQRERERARERERESQNRVHKNRIPAIPCVMAVDTPLLEVTVILAEPLLTKRLCLLVKPTSRIPAIP
jgi:hypothetical protein